MFHIVFHPPGVGVPELTEQTTDRTTALRRAQTLLLHLFPVYTSVTVWHDRDQPKATPYERVYYAKASVQVLEQEE